MTEHGTEREPERVNERVNNRRRGFLKVLGGSAGAAALAVLPKVDTSPSAFDGVRITAEDALGRRVKAVYVDGVPLTHCYEVVPGVNGYALHYAHDAQGDVRVERDPDGLTLGLVPVVARGHVTVVWKSAAERAEDRRKDRDREDREYQAEREHARAERERERRGWDGRVQPSDPWRSWLEGGTAGHGGASWPAGFVVPMAAYRAGQVAGAMDLCDALVAYGWSRRVSMDPLGDAVTMTTPPDLNGETRSFFGVGSTIDAAAAQALAEIAEKVRGTFTATGIAGNVVVWEPWRDGYPRYVASDVSLGDTPPVAAPNGNEPTPHTQAGRAVFSVQRVADVATTTANKLNAVWSRFVARVRGLG